LRVSQRRLWVAFSFLLPSASMLVSCSANFSTPKMEAVYSSETSVDYKGLHSVMSQKREISCLLKNAVFWDVMPCGSCKNRCF
jgi:hypothetical protein